MIAADEDALIADFAETYHVLDWRALPVSTAAALASGLSPDSRVRRKMSGAMAPTDITLLTAAVDRLSLLVWAQSKDAQKGRNRPQMLMDSLTAKNKKGNDVATFRTPEDFEAARTRLLERALKKE